jgi:outer membrane receptor for ferric coprogen and ferric-rhodotorulic acid
MLLPYDEVNQKFVDISHKRNLVEKNLVSTDGYFAGLNLPHQFNDDWSIKNQVSYKRRESANKSACGDYCAYKYANDLTFGGIGFATSDINFDQPIHPVAGIPDALLFTPMVSARL